MCRRDTHTDRASRSQFVLQALFLARGTYIIRVTLGEIKGRGKKTSLASSSLSVCAFTPCFSSSTFPLSYFLPSCSPSLRSPPHYTFDSTSRLLSLRSSLRASPSVSLTRHLSSSSLASPPSPFTVTPLQPWQQEEGEEGGQRRQTGGWKG